MKIILDETNVRLAYRNIKKNAGSKTHGVDDLTIKDLEKVPIGKFIEIVQNRMSMYKPKAVRRVEILKPNGNTRPLGIPAMWDRIVQQCILQVLEPICEAKFYRDSHGFRPNRSPETALVSCYKMIQKTNLHYVVDIDIKGFFDNVNHAQLIKQIWSLGIRDKKLICIIKAMLKAPIILENSDKIMPNKGTPQGGILSPLLSNIVLNELDWWIASQWERFPTKHNYDYVDKHGRNQTNKQRAMRKTKLKEIYIVRYADDFKIFCRKRSDANKIFIAVKQWLKERLKLEVSEDKSKVVNLKKNYSEFLGFKLKAIKKGKKYVVKSHMKDSTKITVTKKLIEQVKRIQKAKNLKEKWAEVTLYNSMVMGFHNYYRNATKISSDMSKVARNLMTVMQNRLKGNLKRSGSLKEHKYIKERYGTSQQMRFIGGNPIIPISYVKTSPPMLKKISINKYTVDGRAEIHKNLGVDMQILHGLMRKCSPKESIEFLDNRISLYAAQNGKCAISGKHLEFDEIYCHHKMPKIFGGTDKYQNLIILHKTVHVLVHTTEETVIQKYATEIELNKDQIAKLNQLRIKAHREPVLESCIKTSKLT